MRVLVSGAGGNMGREVVRAVVGEEDMEVVAAVDPREKGKDIGEICGLTRLGIEITEDLDSTLKDIKPDAAVDFTTPFVAVKNIEALIDNGVDFVVGTTGITNADVEKIREKAAEKGVKGVIAPNFALGAVLMMKLSRMVSRHFDHVEIIELHHDKKVDAPSGTAIKTAQMILEERGFESPSLPEEIEKIEGVRGGELEGIKIHSVRLPGLVAHQQVIFGGLGQTLTIKHDSLNRTSFMPGVVMALRKLSEIEGIIYGLEHLI
ncbi:MAG: 4-hydroxy-tetrahydrodipicolinate reductase [Candidatus Syntrophonatronum acetioxidans]|uniref:4-hydroxy-tetrahydrodipicolinate reductase n=1 Tax=Candidatus Syntrophonatronum acetioxidans TaxID=1795816 RepID=A0A424YEW8_9FIRM|nr:MAG: 4-hydroxy-tetrahydrodipicolinate reductase [Candidatus Syntrophonatronum acetioxidans]